LEKETLPSVTKKSLSREFSFDWKEKPGLSRREEFIEKLSEVIKDLLANNMEKLLSALYRIDVDERKFKLTLAGSAPEEVHLKIAELVFERELEKQKYRKSHRSGPH
jgi:hypothetical protein